MKRWEKAAAALMGASLAYVFWYDVLQCPGCKADRDRAGALRSYQRHRARHTA